MGRTAREWLLYDGCYAHIFTRAIEKRKIFQNDEDFCFFKSRMIVIKKEHAFKIFHYCLMQTHFHMAVQISDVRKFSEAMKILKKDYSYRYNKQHKRFGAVWRYRYKSKLIENEIYLYACGRYIENNPVEAGIVNQAIDWEHSSSRYYAQGIEDEVIDKYSLAAIDPNIVIEGRTFDKQKAVGTDWFQYQILKKLKG